MGQTGEGKLREAVDYVIARLMRERPEFFFHTVWESLQTIGTALGIQRVCIWRNFNQDDKAFYGKLHEWTEGEGIRQDEGAVAALSYEGALHLRGCVESGRVINSPAAELPAGERAALELREGAAVLILPIVADGVPWGFISLEDYSGLCHFSPAEEELLLSAGSFIVSAIRYNDLSRDLEAQTLAARRAAQANELKSIFLARTSHEIRTPMNAIIGMTELVLREELTSDIRSYVMDIKQAGQSLLYIINDILDFSKIESGKQEIVPVPYRFSSLLNDVVSIIRIRAAKKELDFIVNIDSSLPDELEGDMVRIRQTLINILENAVKYTSKGFVALRVTGGIDGTGKARLTMSVEDSGLGIKEEDRERLFQNFVQLDLEKNRGVSGSGLGLAISYNLIRAMGGDITLESTYGKGSTFRIDLTQEVRSDKRLARVDHPETDLLLLFAKYDMAAKSVQEECASLLIRCDVVEKQEDFHSSLESGMYSHVLIAPRFYEAAMQEMEATGSLAEMVFLTDIESRPRGLYAHTLPLPANVMSLANLLNDNVETEENDARPAFSAPDAKVLVVDDNRTNLKVAVGLLKPYNMKVDACESGRQACELVEDNDYDLVFLDHMMPDMDGIETTKQIRGMEHRASLPIIALTANAISGMREFYIENGMNGFLPKPIDVAKLHMELDRWIPSEKKRFIDSDHEKARLDAPVIDGVNTLAGMQMIGGSLEDYFDILESYCSEADGLTKAIRECMTQKDLQRFTIYVHSLKSVAATIGANHIAKEAERLEKAGNAGDRAIVESSINVFLSNFVRQTDVIRKALAKYEDRKAKQKGSSAHLKEQAVLLSRSLDSLDMQEADRVIDDLNGYQWPESVGKLIHSLSDSILYSNLDEAQSYVEEILGLPSDE